MTEIDLDAIRKRLDYPFHPDQYRRDVRVLLDALKEQAAIALRNSTKARRTEEAEAEVERLRAALSHTNTTVVTREAEDCPLCGSPDDVTGKVALTALEYRDERDNLQAAWDEVLTALDDDSNGQRVRAGVRLPVLRGKIRDAMTKHGIEAR